MRLIIFFMTRSAQFQPELLVCRRRLTNSFFLKDRCSMSDQISFILASNWRAFILAMRDKDRANKNEIEIFVFSVTSNDFPHDMHLLIFSSKIGPKLWCRMPSQPYRSEHRTASPFTGHRAG